MGEKDRETSQRLRESGSADFKIGSRVEDEDDIYTLFLTLNVVSTLQAKLRPEKDIRSLEDFKIIVRFLYMHNLKG